MSPLRTFRSGHCAAASPLLELWQGDELMAPSIVVVVSEWRMIR